MIRPDLPIEQLDLSVRALNCLKREGIHTLGELMKLTRDDMLAIRNFGEKSVQEVEQKLRGMGPGLAGDREPRRPRPFAGAGAAAKPVPEEEQLDDAG